MSQFAKRNSEFISVSLASDSLIGRIYSILDLKNYCDENCLLLHMWLFSKYATQTCYKTNSYIQKKILKRGSTNSVFVTITAIVSVDIL